MPEDDALSNEDGWTWLRTERLHRAAEAGDIVQMRALLAVGCDVNAFDEDLARTPLHFAAMRGHLEAVRLLIEAGANVNAIDEERIGDTPLGKITAFCTFEVAKLLIDAGADPTIPGWMQLTALDRSVARTDPEGVMLHQLLVESAQRLHPGWPSFGK